MMKFSLIPLPYKIMGTLLAFGVLVVGCIQYGYNKAENKYIAKIAKMEAEALILQTKLEASLSEVNVQVLTKYVDRVKYLKEKEYVYRDKIVTVPSKCELSNGWVLLHDTVATGGNANSAGISDGATSEIKDTEALRVVLENYGIYKQTAEQLSALQEWVRESKASVDKANKEVIK